MRPSSSVESLCRALGVQIEQGEPLERDLHSYVLVQVGLGGHVRVASEAEIGTLAADIVKTRSSSENFGSDSSQSEVEAPEAPRPPPMQLSHSTGPCSFCGVRESPQWRRGPPQNPVLCNACGTRYRRSNMLAPLRPRMKKRVRAAAPK